MNDIEMMKLKKIDEIIGEVASGKTVVYEAEDYVIANMEAIKTGQIRILPVPRLMTEEEVRGLPEDMFVWIEIKPKHDKPVLYHLRLHSKWYEHEERMFIDFDAPSRLEALWMMNYGKSWRCWTAPPSEEMKEEVKWQ